MTDADLDRHLWGILDAREWSRDVARDRLRLAIDAAVMAEREACVTAVHDFIVSKAGDNYRDQHIGCYFDEAIATIRNRSNTP